MQWATDFYEFKESDTAAVIELVTDSRLEVYQVAVAGFPRQIPFDHPSSIPSLLVTGPLIIPGIMRKHFYVE